MTDAAEVKPATPAPKEPQERIVVTEHSRVIGGKKLEYTATCGTKWVTGGGSPMVVAGLTNGTPVTCTVVARNAIGTSPASAASSSVTPNQTQTITFANPGAQNLGTSPALP